MKGSAILLMLLASLTEKSFSQTTTRKEHKKGRLPTIVGTWRLVEHTDLDTTTGEWIYRYGKNPRGFFMYTKTGIVNLNISTSTPLEISKDSARNHTVNLHRFLSTNAVGYFGTYTVDMEKSIVTHHVEGGSYPWYFDTDQERPFILKGDTLIISNSKTWKRVLVRVD